MINDTSLYIQSTKYNESQSTFRIYCCASCSSRQVRERCGVVLYVIHKYIYIKIFSLVALVLSDVYETAVVLQVFIFSGETDPAVLCANKDRLKQQLSILFFCFLLPKFYKFVHTRTPYLDLRKRKKTGNMGIWKTCLEFFWGEFGNEMAVLSFKYRTQFSLLAPLSHATITNLPRFVFVFGNTAVLPTRAVHSST